jgi:hypothetical protein
MYTSSNHHNLGLPIFLVLSDVDFRSIHPSEADYLVSEQFNFYGVMLLASRPTPNLEVHCIPLRLAPTRHG